ncbi:MAG: 2Fe-2S iron-sulfur cluster-binding protein, partial [Fusobacteriaceae bacterium]
MEMLKVNIDGIELTVPRESTILTAAKSAGINIPYLCYMNMGGADFKNNCASCRICVVEVEGRRNLAPACATPIFEGMVVRTNTMKVMEKRKTILELLLSDHPKDCLVCSKNGECELQTLAMDFGIREIKYAGKESSYKVEISPSIIRDASKCIMCRRCETMCNEIQTCGVLSGIERGFEAVVSTAFDQNLETTPCTYCGQCVAVCPVGALHENDHT